MNMEIEDLSPSAQDYLKVIWDLQEWDRGPVQSSAVAAKTGMKQSTVSGALSRLVDAGLVVHKSYGKVSLTPAGRKSALTMVRRHRLLETFLVEVLGYDWDQVHEEADALEHAVSDMMVDKIDQYLNHPLHDPHGDAIPTRGGSLPDLPPTQALSQVEEGKIVEVQRVSDEDADMLRYLSDHKIGPGSLLEVVRMGSPSCPVILRLVREFGQRKRQRQLSDPAGLSGREEVGLVQLEYIQASLIQVSLIPSSTS